MKFRRNRGDGRGAPSSVDPAFVEALSGRGREGRRGEKKDHKAMMLCRQVRRALGLALAGECGDDVLRELYVEEVLPAPDAGHLMVRVVVPEGVGMVEVLERLGRAQGKLRAIVAGAVTRKRAPELTFVPVASGGGGEVGHE